MCASTRGGSLGRCVAAPRLGVASPPRGLYCASTLRSPPSANAPRTQVTSVRSTRSLDPVRALCLHTNKCVQAQGRSLGRHRVLTHPEQVRPCACTQVCKHLLPPGEVPTGPGVLAHPQKVGRGGRPTGPAKHTLLRPGCTGSRRDLSANAQVCKHLSACTLGHRVAVC